MNIISIQLSIRLAPSFNYLYFLLSSYYVFQNIFDWLSILLNFQFDPIILNGYFGFDLLFLLSHPLHTIFIYFTPDYYRLNG